ncbi:hypothetical protein BN940_01231 [Castellaniella defragrans 65Phen]|uniref:Uncharacterized protein n=1 Tax=Castellaniella defragrans (strain DSM 12143 / CCUG 39792 / 65Phen) TaxID=1437824 RepID=W8WST0_CASD6|nr:hypothetical protein BN940_01231 [Castellaniella defragrans 65Phen]
MGLATIVKANDIGLHRIPLFVEQVLESRYHRATVPAIRSR